MSDNESEREHWNERYRDDEHDPPTAPTDLLERYVYNLPNGRALDVATGGGRNAIFLAERGYDVDAIDISGEGLAIARERADERGVDVGFVRGDIEGYEFPRGTYDVIVVSHYYSLNALPALKRTLAPGGVLLYEHRLDPPGDDSHRFRFQPNDLLRACLDLRIVHYEEPVTLSADETRVELLARKSP